MRGLGAALISLAVVTAGPPHTSFGSSRTLPFLHARDSAIVDEKDRPVILRGCNLGNWFLLEPWMLGMSRPGDSKDQWSLEQLLAERFGAAKKNKLLETYQENWITARDFEIIKSWGFNVVRLPFSYGLLEDDIAPGKLRADAFKWLDHAVELAEQAGLYVILDMHGAPGGQSTDAPTGRAGQNKFWLPENRERAAFLWKRIAEHYHGKGVIAAYDLLNEPFGDFHKTPDDETLVATMSRLIDAIREVDPTHLVFCAGSLRGIAMYGPPLSRHWENVGYTEHYYPGLYGDVPSLETHARFLSQSLRAKKELLSSWKAPFLVGEFNVVLDKAGGSAMMRRYYDTYAVNGWAATLWSYKLLKEESGAHPDPWYMVTNAPALHIPSLKTAPIEEIQNFFASFGTMELAQNEDLRTALNATKPPALILYDYPFVTPPAPQDVTNENWKGEDIGGPYLAGGQHLSADAIEVFGSGRDIYEEQDEFHFVARSVAGDFQLAADVTPPLETNRYAKAGLMFRQSGAADAPLVMICLTPDGACTLAVRRKPGARIEEERLSARGAVALQLSRKGNLLEVTARDDASRVMAGKSISGADFAAEADAGLFVCSHDALLLSKATFSKIQFETSQPTTIKP